MPTIKYGTHEIDTATLPEVSATALMRRGLAHFLGNEQASKVASFVKASKEPVTDEAKAAKLAEFVASAKEALIAGTIGSNVRGPRGSAVETVERALAKAEVISILSNLSPKVKFPKGEEKVEFADGTKLSGEELIARRLAKHGDRLRKEAEAKMKADARKAEKVGEAAKGLAGLDALDA